MLLYKVLLTKNDHQEILYRSISNKIKLPPLELSQKHAGAILVITTCDPSMLDEQEIEIFKAELKAA